MPVERKYRGRVITLEDIAFLREFLADHSGLSRRKLSAKVCEAWQWKQANGALCDMVCRGLLLMLHRAGEIQLPEVRVVAHNPFVKRERPQPMLIDTTPVIAPLKELRFPAMLAIIILRRSQGLHPCQSLTVVPRHPVRRCSFHIR